MSWIIYRIARFVPLYLFIALLLSGLPQMLFRVSAAGVRHAAPIAQGSGNCSSWANACTLQTALSGAASGDQVWVKAGVHKPTTNPADRAASFALKSGVAVYGGFTGNETSLEQRNWQTNRTILSGDIDNNDLDGNGDGVIENVADIVGANSYHVVVGSGANATAVLDGFTITAGQANGSGDDGRGGGIFNVVGSPALANLILNANMAAFSGGGMWNQIGSSTLSNVTFQRNSAASGGGLYHDSGNLTLTNMTFDGNSAATGSGGGMFNAADSRFTLTTATFRNNTAANIGGGMYNQGVPNATLTDVIFTGNSAQWGGGMGNLVSSPSLTNVTFAENSASDKGGGMYNVNGSQPTLSGVTLRGNTAAAYGGGMYNYNSSPSLTNVSFIENQVTDSTSYGGGMANQNDSSPTLIGVTFRSNAAVFRGGGMYTATGSPTLRDVTFADNTANQGAGMLNDGSFPQLTAVTFSSNRATNGGGMYNRNSSLPTLVNVTFSGNSATETGGGMVNVGTHTRLTNVTFYGNTATNNGGGLYNNSGANPELINVILWGNLAAAGGQIFNTASNTATITNSDIRGCGGSGSGWNTDCGTDGGGNIDADPRLGPLANNGGATLTHALLPVSAAVDVGDNSVCPASDQRGVSRPQLANCDMGAVEYVPPSRLYVDDTAAGQNTGLSWADALNSLQDALLAAGAGTEIWVAEGVYYPDEGVRQTDNNRAHSFDMRNGIALYGGFVGNETVRDPRSWVVYRTILSGDIDQNDTNSDGNFIAETSAHIQGANSYHVVEAEGTNDTGVLDGFFITAGQANGSAYPAQQGGGLVALSARPTLANLFFSGNMATDIGGGLYSNNAGSSFILTNITFQGNSASEGGGMGSVASSPSLRGGWFTDNTASGLGGGMLADGGAPTLSDLMFSNNRAGDGAGMYTRNGSLPVLANVIFSANAASDDGGGMVNRGTGPVLNGVTFVGNTAVNTGGGVVNRDGAFPELNNAVFSGNRADYGGGIFNDSSNPVLVNATFSGNTALNAGGGMYNWNSTVSLFNAILWGNSAPSGAQLISQGGGATNIASSDVQGCGGSGSGWNTACGTDGGGNVDVDPLFRDPDGPDNVIGTADDNLDLQSTSPVIDAGVNSVMPLPTDRAGLPRFVDVPTVPDTGIGTPPIIDMGAYEFFVDVLKIFLPLVVR